MTENEMKYLLLPAGPILDILGGEKWLETRKQTTKAEERIFKKCQTCGAREPLVTLLKCNSCKYTYYWACQKAHWSHHNERAEKLKNIERLSLTDPDTAQRAADWSSCLKHKFRVLACGVFCIKDVLHDIETHMGLERGEGQVFVDNMFPKAHDVHARIHFVDLYFGHGVSASLGTGAMNSVVLRENPYDPDGRKGFNVGAPPKPLVLRSGAKDVKHIF
ncbi:hypothetical protein B0H16DRAFT_1459265 [Mycena metata]|uniref:MYND-type domain-containing protein n=1 Tax=Mycena metata TaxID=1033252 RepID=A0AAD7IZV8_9AGAR|nr:hypothetical protein B0H16DRAFT_1459265 [Mycena metata]